MDNIATAVLDYGHLYQILEADESVTIPIEIVDDVLVEDDETFTVQIHPLVINGDVSPSDTQEVTITIIDNDGKGILPADDRIKIGVMKTSHHYICSIENHIKMTCKKKL